MKYILVIYLFLLSGSTLAEKEKRSSLLPFANGVAMDVGKGVLIKEEIGDGQTEVRVWIGFGSSIVERALFLKIDPKGNVQGEILIHFATDLKYLKEKEDEFKQSILESCKDLRVGEKGTSACTQIFSEEPEWQNLYKKLLDLGLLTLPDQNDLEEDRPRYLDGVALVVEIRKGKDYRFYEYVNPKHQKSPEAKAAVKIMDFVQSIFEEE